MKSLSVCFLSLSLSFLHAQTQMNRELHSGQDKRNGRPRVRVKARQKKIRDRDIPSHRPRKGRDRREAETQRHSPREMTQKTERLS